MRIIASSPSLETKIIKYPQLNTLEGHCLLDQGRQNPQSNASCSNCPPVLNRSLRLPRHLAAMSKTVSPPQLYTGDKVCVGKG